MTTQTVQACPNCNRTDLRQRKRAFDSRGKPRRGNPDDQYTCDGCGETFSEPVLRESENVTGDTRHGVAKALLDADPDAVGGGA